MSPFGAEGALLPQSAPWVEKQVSGYCALKNVNSRKVSQKRSSKFYEGVFQKKTSTKIALGPWAARSTAHPLVVVPPTDDFLITPLKGAVAYLKKIVKGWTIPKGCTLLPKGLAVEMVPPVPRVGKTPFC